MFADKDGKLSVPARLAAGAGAAAISTLVRDIAAFRLHVTRQSKTQAQICQVTYPLDIIRFRMAVDPTLNTIPAVVRAVIRDEGPAAFYKGLVPSIVGIAPYSSINFAAFDLCVLHVHIVVHRAGGTDMRMDSPQAEEGTPRQPRGQQHRHLRLLSLRSSHGA